MRANACDHRYGAYSRASVLMPTVPAAAKNSARLQQVDAGHPPAEACARDTERLQRLRAEPNPEEIRKFERDLTCEQLRPQVQRLCDSICR